MSFSEMLDELPRLTPGERQQLVAKALELDGDWIAGEDHLSTEEQRLIEARMAEHAQDPASAIPWEQARARLQARFRR